MYTLARTTTALLIAGAMAGCAADGSLETSAVNGQSSQQQAKVDPVCTALVGQIEELRRDGIAEKVEKAANKKYKMNNADLVKADQLNKANGDFQAKCTPQPVQASVKPVTPPQ
jgi:hypothetical protein